MSAPLVAVTGWDVGGVNTKAARVAGGELRALRSVPFEIQRSPDELAPLIARIARELDCGSGDHHAVTMTAELSQYFQTKREGVAFVLDAFERALPGSTIRVFGTDGIFRSVHEARREPLSSAASNWAATATLVAGRWPNAVLVDVGSTTTDIIPIHDGMVVARGRTDPDRLRTGELLYLGALRTPVEAITREVPLGAAMAGVSAEAFALVGDVYLWLGEISASEYTVPTPDGRAADRAGARDRLARVVCADGEMLDDAAIDAMAQHVAQLQAQRVARSLERVIAHNPSISSMVTAGLGSFIARRAASLMRPTPLAVEELGADFTPAAAVALLLAGRPHLSVTAGQSNAIPGRSPASIATVVKVGGALLGRQGALDVVVPVLSRVAERGDPVLIVPGGGPFADAVRRIDSERGIPDDAAHWMAILAMNQYAELLASLVPRTRLVETMDEIASALESGRLPVLAPYRWLREVDPLPHSWDVTSDSIAAWVAGEIGAARLVLIKAVKVERPELVDRYFERSLSPGLELVITDASGCSAVLGA